ncbi:RNA-directed DNA polymerase, eukaryota, reverse transcriptase zinc-binding domain protein [Tanacetum coccineum]
MNKVEPKKLPVWVKIVNVPLEAWCVKGISAMATSLGKPILMDSMTAAMCHKSTGNISYASVLVEMDSEKERKNEIEIQSGNYANVKNNQYSQKQSNGFGRIDRPENSRKEYKKRQADADANVKSKEKNKWKVGENAVDEIRKSSNKYYVLDSLPEDNDLELIMLKERMIVDKYLNEKVQHTLQESILWSKDMIEYFKERWERDRIKENTPTNMEDVLEANDGIANVMKSKKVNGIEGEVLNDVFNGV